MKYLSGVTNARVEPRLVEIGAGLLIQPKNGYVRRVGLYASWAADNGCARVIGGQVTRDPDWECAKWGRMLGAIADLPELARRRMLFALVPDWPCDHDRTLIEFERWADVVRAFRYPVAFAIQDGATVETVPWDDFDVAFLAGSTEWKCGEPAYEMAVAARNRGKWVHMGRVNSWDRIDWASRIGCDSSDGTYVKHGPPAEMVETIAGWISNNGPRLTQMGAQVA